MSEMFVDGFSGSFFLRSIIMALGNVRFFGNDILSGQ